MTVHKSLSTRRNTVTDLYRNHSYIYSLYQMFKVPSTLTQWMVPERLHLQTRRRRNYRKDGLPVVKHRGSSDTGATLYILNYSMWQSPSWEANQFSTSQ